MIVERIYNLVLPDQLHVGDRVNLEMQVQIARVEDERVDVTAIGDVEPRLVPGRRVCDITVLRVIS